MKIETLLKWNEISCKVHNALRNAHIETIADLQATPFGDVYKILGFKGMKEWPVLVRRFKYKKECTND